MYTTTRKPLWPLAVHDYFGISAGTEMYVALHGYSEYQLKFQGAAALITMITDSRHGTVNAEISLSLSPSPPKLMTCFSGTVLTYTRVLVNLKYMCMCSISRISLSWARAGCKKTLCLLHYPRKIKFVHSLSLSYASYVISLRCYVKP